jgi:lactaldehyde dehydrogenase/glycolaldehyde dehydrogenase
VTKDYRNFVNGVFATKASLYSQPVLNPATNQTLGRMPDSNAAEVDAAVFAAREGQTWLGIRSQTARLREVR